MSPERWQEVARIFGLAVDAAADERAAILAFECAGDGELLREVEELLAADAPSGDLQGLVDQALGALAGAPPEAVADLAETGLSIGQTIDGRYTVVQVLGAGAMGVVVEAEHRGLDERVAIKLLKPQALSTERTRLRFLREAKAAAKIKSPHVVKVRDVGTLPSGAPFMVMDMLEGADVAAVLKARGPLPFTKACQLAMQACEALATAHAAEIIHRDIKPANLFLERASHGEVLLKLLDFGISKVGADDASDEEGVLTRSHDLVGSPTYMSPEQLRSSRDVDARSDIWSLGVVIYEMLSGARPFVASSFADLSMQILADPPAPVTGPWPEALSLVVLRCLEKDPRARYADVGELAVALAPFCGAEGRRGAKRVLGTLGEDLLGTADLVITTSHDGVAEAASTVASTSVTASTPPPWRWLGLLVLAAGIGGVAWLSTERDETAPVPTAPGSAAPGSAAPERPAVSAAPPASSPAPLPSEAAASATARPSPPQPPAVVGPPPKPPVQPTVDPYGSRK